MAQCGGRRPPLERLRRAVQAVRSDSVGGLGRRVPAARFRRPRVTLSTRRRIQRSPHRCNQSLYLVRGMRYCFRVRVAASSVAKPASPWSRPCDATTTDQGLQTVSDADRMPPQPEAAPTPAGPSPAAAFASPFAPPPAPRAPQPVVVQQTTYYSSSPSPQIYVPRPAPAPPRRSSSGGARMGTVLRNDGMPDRRYASPRPVTNSGRPDRRFSVNRPATSSTRSSGSSSGRRSGGARRK